MLKERVVLGAAVVAASLITATGALAAPPEIEITRPTPNEELLVGETVIAEFNCVDPDDPEGPVSCSGSVDTDPVTPIDSGETLPTASAGTLTLTVDASDDNPITEPSQLARDFAVVSVRCADIPDVTVSRNGTVAIEPNCEKAADAEWETAEVTTPPPDGEGTVTIDDETGKLVYKAPGTDFTGPTSFEYRVHDDETGYDTTTRTVTVDVGPCADIGPIPALSTPIGGLPSEVELDCGALDDSDSLVIETAPQHGALDDAGLPSSVRYTPGTGYAGPDSFTYFLDDGTPDPIPATVTIDVATWTPGGGGGGGGDDGGSGGGGGRSSDGGIVEPLPDEPGPGLPPLPRLPSLDAGGPGSGNIPTRFGRQTGVTVQDRTLRANRRGRFAIELRNVNPFAVAADLKVTGAFRKNRKGKRVPRLRLREPDLRLAAQRTTTVKLRLDRRGRRLLADERRLKLKLELRVRDVEGARRTITERFTLRAPKGAGRRG